MEARKNWVNVKNKFFILFIMNKPNSYKSNLSHDFILLILHVFHVFESRSIHEINHIHLIPRINISKTASIKLSA